MSIEQQKQNNETVDELFNDISAQEKAELPKEHLPMWNAENIACFPHFINFAHYEMEDVLVEARNGDKDSINALSIAYKNFKDGLEYDLSEYTPDIYELYIDALARGDADNAAMYINQYIKDATVEAPLEDDDD